MRTLSSGHMFHAANKCGWDEEQKMTVYCSHIATIIHGGDFDKLFEATKNWSLDSGIETQLVLLSLAHIIDQIEAAPDYKGERFEDYLKSLLEASGAKTTTDEAKKPEAAKTGKGRKGKGTATAAKQQVPKKAPKGTSAPPATRSKPDERPYPFDDGPEVIPSPKPKPEQKFPAGTVAAPEPDPAPVSTPPPPPAPPVAAGPPKVMLVGYLEQPFADVSKQLLALETPLKEQRLGALMAQQKFVLPEGRELLLELVNARPKPGVYVSIAKDQKCLPGATVVVRDQTERFEITYQGTTYKVLPPGG